MKTLITSAALLCCALLFVSVAGADEMPFTLTGQGLDAAGTFYGAPIADGQWLVSDASGLFNGSNIVGIWPESNTGNIFSFDNLFFASGPFVDGGGIVFKLDNGDMVNLCFDTGCAGAAETYTAIVWDPVTGITNLNADSAEFGAPTPEPSTLMLLGSGLAGLARLGRRALAT
jgi:hypothetical protein